MITRTLALLAALALALVPTGTALAAAPDGKTAPVTPATTWHGLPVNNAGFSDQANGACPAISGNPKCDGGIHGIAANPGQSGNKPKDRGTPPSCDMHAGFQGVKRNC